MPFDDGKKASEPEVKVRPVVDGKQLAKSMHMVTRLQAIREMCELGECG